MRQRASSLVPTIVKSAVAPLPLSLGCAPPTVIRYLPGVTARAPRESTCDSARGSRLKTTCLFSPGAKWTSVNLEAPVPAILPWPGGGGIVQPLHRLHENQYFSCQLQQRACRQLATVWSRAPTLSKQRSCN